MLLKNKTALIFGAGGSIGKEVARAFGREGARLYLSGRNRETVDPVAADITAAGGHATVAQVDALDEKAVDAYVADVARDAGHVDVVFNLTGPQPVEYKHGLPALELPFELFKVPMATVVASQFLTARAAARHMLDHGNGVVLLLSASLARNGAPLSAHTSSAFAAVEGLTRCLANEWGPKLRVVCVRSEAMPETRAIKQTFAAYARTMGMTTADFERFITEKNPLKRLPSTKDTANIAAFAASDLAATITGATLNSTCGAVLD